ncbi:hypothetical protein [Flavobacterium sp. N3904]|uniref:hypothetical protein n=1 Tax=Flavobacterium sp. N3904 TaxID=2986835 RepID=UPI00222557E1|nr:hypothetical protein [Flavobacterium sp. N3904]
MKTLVILVFLAIGVQTNAMQVIKTNDNCFAQTIKSAAIGNGIVKRTNGEIVTTKETMYLEIDTDKHTVIIELNDILYDLVLYRTDKKGTIYAATLNGKQIIKININLKTNEVETLIGDLIFITYIHPNNSDSRPIAVED